MKNQFIQPAAWPTDPTVGGRQAANSDYAAGRHQATGHIFATSQDQGCTYTTLQAKTGPPVAIQNLIVLVAARTGHLAAAFA